MQLVDKRGSCLLGQKSAAEVVDFNGHADLVARPGHYVVYWEVKGAVGDGVLEECCGEMDAAFGDHVVSRKSSSIGPLELRIVGTRTFRKILDYYISQFKTPRCTSNQVLLRILDGCTVKRFRSTAYGWFRSTANG